MVASITIIQFPPESHFDSLLSVPSIGTVPNFQMICLISLCHDFDLNSDEETVTYT
jgi:hypothetical protein